MLFEIAKSIGGLTPEPNDPKQRPEDIGWDEKRKRREIKIKEDHSGQNQSTTDQGSQKGRNQQEKTT
jgi:hypothetical protein